MHVGYGSVFQNPNNQLSDREVWLNEIRLAEMAEPLGFDSVWAIEHHFDDYTMCPDPVQFLTYMAGRTKHVKLGSMVIVVPWHDPIRVAEQVSMLVMLPLMFVLIGQLAGVILLNTELVVYIAIGVAVVDAGLMAFAVNLFQRETILTRWR